jgi:AcrR family transcriptional regulator
LQTIAHNPDHPTQGSSRFDGRKEEILNAAGAVFNRHGLRDATLAVVAAEIELNLKSLRYYFERREDLVAAAFMRSIELHRKLAEDALVEQGVETRIRRFVRSYFELRASVQKGERPEFVHFGDLRSLTEPHSDVVWPAYNRMFKAIRQLFRTPEMRWARDRLNASARMLLSQLLWSVIWASEYFPEDAPRIAERTSDILLYGVSARPLDQAELVGAAAVVDNAKTESLSQRSFLRTATALINEFGYRGASVERISAELNVTKGCFYHHNKSRDGLVTACFEHTFAVLREAQDAALAAGTDGLSRVAAAAISLVNRQMLTSGALLRTSALTAVEPEMRSSLAQQMSRLTRRFSDMLNDGIIDGSVQACDVRIAGEMMTGMINSAEELGRWARNATADTATELYVVPLLTGLLRRSSF